MVWVDAGAYRYLVWTIYFMGRLSHFTGRMIGVYQIGHDILDLCHPRPIGGHYRSRRAGRRWIEIVFGIADIAAHGTIYSVSIFSYHNILCCVKIYAQFVTKYRNN